MFDAFRGGDPRALAEVIADDATWTVPGSAPVARVYRGRHEIFELFRATRRLTDGTYRSDCVLSVGERLGRSLDIDQVLVITLRDGRWQQIVAVPTEPDAFAAFWA